MIYSKDILTQTLKANIVNVTFTKKDGTERVMKCTLIDNMLPAREVKEDATPRKENDEVVKVFDLDKNAWRSFRVDSVKDVDIIQNFLVSEYD